MTEIKQKTIGTHNGTFHCDEALACFMLLQTNEFRGAKIIRSRDPAVLNECDANVDVGGTYVPDKYRFDHHQIGFTGTLSDNHGTKLSSAGLVYKHFGGEVIHNMLGTDAQTTEVLFLKIYKNFIEGIDAIDNGIDRFDTKVEPKYVVSTDLGSRVGHLNPWWNDPNPQHDERFKLAVELTGKEFTDCVNYYGKAWLPARAIVEKAINTRFDVDPSGEIIVLDQFAPWKSHLYELEEELKMPPVIKYALFADTNGSWRIQAVSVSESSFANRLDIPWKGMRDEQLSEASGIPGGIFVHVSGFIGGNKTKEGALEMARKALQLGKQEPDAKRNKVDDK